MAPPGTYTAKLGAGLGLVSETKALLELWEAGMSARDLYQTALESGRFPHMTAKRLQNMVRDGFAPRYMANGSAAARDLKRLALSLPTADFQQLLLIYTARAHPILGDFIREVYWGTYESGSPELTNAQARHFVERAMEAGKMASRWTDGTVQNVAGFLPGCCADFGMLESGRKTRRRFTSFHITPSTAVYLAYERHFAGLGDNAVLAHEDWALFGLSREEVLSELKALSRKGLMIVQAAGEVVRISWTIATPEELCRVLTES